MPKPAKITSLLPEREAAICERLRTMRMESRRKMQEAAAAAGISKDRWASYEYGRAPVRYDLGRKACQMFGCSQRWLATGDPPRQHYVPVPDQTARLIPERALFSEAFDKHLAPEFDHHYQEVSRVVRLPVDRLDEAQQMVGLLNQIMSGAGRAAIESILAQARQVSLIPEKIWTALPDSEIQEQAHLLQAAASILTRLASTTTAKTIDTLPGEAYDSATEMKNLWQPWKNRLKKVCAPDGAKARCARELQVSRQLVSKWLEETEPTADFALRLIGWIEKEERAMAGK